MEPASNWSFLNAYGGAIGLGERIESFEAFRLGQAVKVIKAASGEFRSDILADSVRFTIQTASHLSYLPYVSGVTDDQAVLLLSDLLPESVSKVELSIDFDLPEGWRVEPAKTSAEHLYTIQNPERGVFIAGRDLRVVKRSVGGMPLRVVINGPWPFSAKAVLDSASQIYQQYYSMVGFKLRQAPTIIVGRLPLSSAAWRAETRGSTVTLLLNSGVNTGNWRGQLGVIFTHEIFHFWVPNSLALRGEYDWFFEGFTMYVALQMALKLKLIGFQEYLNTLSRVYNSYLASPDNQTLIQASASRWTTSNSLVYNKGMLVAFIYDLTLRLTTQGRSTLATIYPLLFRSVDEPADANDAIIRLLTSSPSTSSFSGSYIESTERINIERVLPSFGFQVSTESEARISVGKDLTNEQKKLLRSLGYRE